MEIPLSRPYKTEQALVFIKQVLESPYVSTGPFIKEFESSIKQFTKARFAESCSSGTAGLHLIVKALHIGHNDEVITTPYSFIATSNVLLYEGVFPIFCDIEEKHLNLSYEKTLACIEKNYKWKDGKLINKTTGRTLRGIMPVHIYGYPAHMKGFMELKEKYGLYIIEDSAEALGSYLIIDGKKSMLGTIGDAGVYAFYANKQLTTGEGGMVVTDNEEIYNRILSLRNQGRSLNSEWLLHESIGYNYRMSSLNAALGFSQVKLMEEIVSKRNAAYERYRKMLSEVDGIKVFETDADAGVNWFVFVVKLKESVKRESVSKYLAQNGVQTRPYFDPPLHLQPVYRAMLPYKPGDFPVAESNSKKVLAIPFYTGITEEEQDYVVTKLKEALILA